MTIVSNQPPHDEPQVLEPEVISDTPNSTNDNSLGFYHSLPTNILGGWNPEYTSDEYVIIGTEGGIGDNVCHIPMIRSVRELHPDSKIILNPSHHEPFLSLPYVDKVYNTPDYTVFDENLYDDYIKKFNCPYYRASSLYGYLEMSTHFDKRQISEIICDLARVPFPGNDVIELEQSETELRRSINLYKSFNNPGKVIVIQTEGSKYIQDLQNPEKLNGNTKLNLNKDWFGDYWQEVVAILVSKGFTVVQVGLPMEQPIDGAVNLLGKWDLRTIINFLSLADAFINIDSLLNHIGYGWRVKGVVLFGRTDPNIFGHEDFHLNLINTKACPDLYCQRAKSSTGDVLVVNGEPIPWVCTHRSCMRAIEPGHVFDATMSAWEYNQQNPNKYKQTLIQL